MHSNELISSAEAIGIETLLAAFRKMLIIRRAEQRIAEDFVANKIFSFYHSSAGQEAVAVGVGMALESEDKMFGNHRSHGHYLSKGGDLYRMFAEIYGKADGCCRGHGGSMHMLDRSVGFMGSAPILGSIVPIATGCAFAQKVAGNKNATIVFFGDGASEEGGVYESINLAALWKLPIIFVIEDNLYAVASPRSSRRSDRYSLEKVVVGLGAAYLDGNGNRFEDVYSTATQARARAVYDHIPVVIHATVFREMAHSGPIKDEKSRIFDSASVRSQACPIMAIMSDLRNRGVSDPVIEDIEKQVDELVNDAWERAKRAPAPERHQLMEAVYS